MGKFKTLHEPTDLQRQTVKLHATVGTPQELIADIIGIDSKTLRKHYREELDHSGAKANANVGGALFNKAMGGDTTAMIFWMKTRGRWSEQIDVNNKHDVSDAMAELMAAVAVGTKRIGS